jgi:predicted nucleic acid-binding protein
VNIFVDTNVFLAATDPRGQSHQAALTFLQEGEDALFMSPQIMREYLVVATRPTAVNGLGLSVRQALENVDMFMGVATLVFEPEAAWRKLRELLQAPDPPSGKRVHDANIAATALANGLTTVATFNAQDFVGLAVEVTVPPAVA